MNKLTHRIQVGTTNGMNILHVNIGSLGSELCKADPWVVQVPAHAKLNVFTYSIYANQANLHIYTLIKGMQYWPRTSLSIHKVESKVPKSFFSEAISVMEWNGPVHAL